ncbi:carbohydrate kinase family protein [Candidatus Saccharibacteria bacterium]|nr:carbohydrate kinase family protein [Candidatus Saccharibacteria bacterium]NCS83164.1 carbohydrate kinase family protein [Candidatus Saccharibacteria bacterium]
MSVPVIVTIGKSTQDVFLKSTKAFEQHEHKGVVYEQLPVGKKLDLDEVTFATGGNVTNAAVTFARQGLHSTYTWCLGVDPASEGILRDLDKEGVDTQHVYRGDEYRASYSVILMLQGGERTILNYKGSMPNIDSPHLDLSAIDNSDWVYLSSLGDIDLLEKIVSRAAKQGAKVMLNPAGAELAHPDRLRTILEDVEVLIVNKEEAQQIVEGNSLEELARHGRHYVPVAIVSDGPNGAVAIDKDKIVTAGMYEDVPVIDRTGGGDAFGSGFLSYYSQGKSLKESMLFASANSTSVVQYVGAKEGILHKGVDLHDMPIEEKDA